MAEEQISINVWLAGRSYRIRINADEEESVRNAVKIADDKIGELRTHYAGKDDQDFVAMCLLMYAADNPTEALNIPSIQKRLAVMASKIEAALKDQ